VLSHGDGDLLVCVSRADALNDRVVLRRPVLAGNGRPRTPAYSASRRWDLDESAQSDSAPPISR
jgi:hypothetical protein